jgi:phosphoglycerate dehydrogenase-like enzyme
MEEPEEEELKLESKESEEIFESKVEKIQKKKSEEILEKNLDEDILEKKKILEVPQIVIKRENVAIIGCGLIGTALSKLLLKTCNVNVWNRTADKTKPLVELGAKVF